MLRPAVLRPGHPGRLNYGNPALASQLWTIDNYKIVSAGSCGRMCLDLGSYEPGAPFGLNYCNDNLSSQKWLFRWTT